MQPPVNYNICLHYRYNENLSFDTNMKNACLLLTALLFARPVMAQQHTINQPLADSLDAWATLDQTAAGFNQERWKNVTREERTRYCDSVFALNEKRLTEVMNKYGFPGFDLVGEKGSSHFWLITQHCDKDVAFQQRVLDSMKVAVANHNANPQNYAYLADRVLINTGKKQLYGTQVTYNTDSCQAIPKPLADSLTVNTRRGAIGLESIEAYLNTMSTMHFEMNKAGYKGRGIHKPKLLVEPKQ